MSSLDEMRWKSFSNAAIARGMVLGGMSVDDIELASAIHGGDVVGVECGECVAWFQLWKGELWTCLAISPMVADRSYSVVEWYEAERPKEWVLCGTIGEKKRGKDIVLGDDECYVAAKLPGKQIKLAFVMAGDGGKPSRLVMEPGTPWVDYDSVRLNWFVVKGKNDGCGYLFARGVTTFPNYINFVQRVGRANKDVAGGVYEKRDKRKKGS